MLLCDSLKCFTEDYLKLKLKLKLHFFTHLDCPSVMVESAVGKSFFGCETKLRAVDTPRIEIVPGSTSLGKDAVSEALQMLETLLAKRSRRLTPQQWEFVALRVAVEPTALYVRLALIVVGEELNIVH